MPKTAELHVTLHLDLTDQQVTEIAEETGIELDDVRTVVKALLGKRRFEQEQLRSEVARLRSELDGAAAKALRPAYYREAAASLRVLLDGLLPIDDRTMGLRYAATRLERAAQDLEGDLDHAALDRTHNKGERPVNREPVQERKKSPEELAREREVRAKLQQLERMAANATKADALREFADAHRFPPEWIMYRRDDGSGVTVSDLLRETANRLDGKTDD